MSIIEKLKTSSVDGETSKISIGLETNTILWTLLDVLVETHLEGKDEAYKDRFEKFVGDTIQRNNEKALKCLTLIDPK